MGKPHTVIIIILFSSIGNIPFIFLIEVLYFYIFILFYSFYKSCNHNNCKNNYPILDIIQTNFQNYFNKLLFFKKSYRNKHSHYFFKQVK